MKDIPGYEGLYAITEDGRVWSYPKSRSSRNGKWLKLQLATNEDDRLKPRSHYQVGLHKDGKVKQLLVHRLVALTYIPNPDNKPEVNHKDTNSLHNHVDNLEWCTNQENWRHANGLGLIQEYTEMQRVTRRENGRKTIALNSLKRKCYPQLTGA